MAGAGIDVGTRLVKACIVEDGKIAGSAIVQPGKDLPSIINEMYEGMLKESGLKRRHVRKLVSTGYGSGMVDFADYSLADEICIARGVNSLAPQARVAVDVGGLFIRVVSISESGFMDDSHINEPCAAGSGKFLELVSGAAGIGIEHAGERAALSVNPYEMQSTCAVFAESEVISVLNQGGNVNSVIAGVFKSIALKAASLLQRSGRPDGGLYASGGMALFPEFVRLLADATETEVLRPGIDPRLIPSYGAALIASASPREKDDSIMKRFFRLGKR